MRQRLPGARKNKNGYCFLTWPAHINWRYKKRLAKQQKPLKKALGGILVFQKMIARILNKESTKELQKARLDLTQIIKISSFSPARKYTLFYAPGQKIDTLLILIYRYKHN